MKDLTLTCGLLLALSGCLRATSERESKTPWIDKPTQAAEDALSVSIEWTAPLSSQAPLKGKLGASTVCASTGTRTVTQERVTTTDYTLPGLIVAGAGLTMLAVAVTMWATTEEPESDERAAQRTVLNVGAPVLSLGGGELLRRGERRSYETIAQHEETRANKAPSSCFSQSALTGMELGVVEQSQVLARGRVARSGLFTLRSVKPLPTGTELRVVVTKPPPSSAGSVLGRGLVLKRIAL